MASEGSLGVREAVPIVDFRYHLVSIIAIFLALALGIVIGTTELNGLVLDNLRGSISKLSGDKRGLEGSVNELRGRASAGDAFATSVAAQAVRGLLTGRTVVVLSAPDAPAGQRDALLPLLREAGATVTTTARFRPDLLDPAKAAQLESVVASSVPAGLVLPAGDPVARAATELAFALVRAPGQPAISNAAVQIISAYASADLLDLDRPVRVRAELALVLVGPAETDPPTAQAAAQSAAQTSALLGLATALDGHSSGVVVAGPVSAADPGGALAPLRDDRQRSAAMGSVDGADEPQGRVAVVQALAQQLSGGSGRFGRGRSADSPLPSPRPS